MSGNKVQNRAGNVYFNANETTPLCFSPVLVKSMIDCPDRIPGKNRYSVLAALITQVESEGIVHPGHLCDFSDFVDLLRAFDAAINFLQADQIRMLRINHAGDARQIEFFVYADANVDVVSHHPQLVRSPSRFTRVTRLRRQSGAENQKRRKKAGD